MSAPLSENPTYSTVHRRTRRWLGKASVYRCEQCGEQAKDWAYDGLDPEERTEVINGRAMLYSLYTEHYVPLCRSCHRLKDLAMYRERHGIAAPEVRKRNPNPKPRAGYWERFGPLAKVIDLTGSGKTFEVLS